MKITGKVSKIFNNEKNHVVVLNGDFKLSSFGVCSEEIVEGKTYEFEYKVNGNFNNYSKFVELNDDIQEVDAPIVDMVENPVSGYDGAFLGMCYNQAWMNAREYEKTYEDARNKLDKYYADTLKAAKLLLKGQS